MYLYIMKFKMIFVNCVFFNNKTLMVNCLFNQGKFQNSDYYLCQVYLLIQIALLYCLKLHFIDILCTFINCRFININLIKVF